MRPDKIGWTIFDVTTGRAVALSSDLLLVGVGYDDTNRLLDLLNAGDRRWWAALANETAAIFRTACPRA